MSINVEVTKNGTENPLSLLRRFTKRVHGAGVLPKVRSNRYHERSLSFYKRKVKALVSIKRKEDTMEKIKLGLINPDAQKKKK